MFHLVCGKGVTMPVGYRGLVMAYQSLQIVNEWPELPINQFCKRWSNILSTFRNRSQQSVGSSVGVI